MVIKFLRLILTLSLILFIAALLISYNPHDTSWFYSSTKNVPITNFCGAFGAHIAALLIYLWGASAYLLLLGCLCYFSMIYYDRFYRQEIDRFCACLLLMISSATLCALHRMDFLSPLFPGGSIGFSVARFLYSIFIPFNAHLLLWILVSASLIILSRMLLLRALFSYFMVLRKSPAWLAAQKEIKRFFSLFFYAVSGPFLFFGRSIFRMVQPLLFSMSDRSSLDFDYTLLSEKEGVDTIADDDFWKK